MEGSSLIQLYWDIGKYVSQKVEKERWGKSIVQALSEYIQKNEPTIKGFSARNIWTMKQFYETYKEYEKLPSVMAEISWKHNRRIMSLKTPEERAFYLNLCAKEHYSVRELERNHHLHHCKEKKIYHPNSTIEYSHPPDAAHIRPESIFTKGSPSRNPFRIFNFNSQSPLSGRSQ